MRIHFMLIFLLLSIEHFAQQNEKVKFELSNYLIDSQEIDTVISESCAIFISPDSEKIEELKKQYGEEDFYVLADDHNYYIYESSELMNKLQITSHYLKSGVIQLLGNKNTWTIQTNNVHAPNWFLIFFHVDKKPQIRPLIISDEKQIEDYFGRD